MQLGYKFPLNSFSVIIITASEEVQHISECKGLLQWVDAFACLHERTNERIIDGQKLESVAEEEEEQ